MPAGKFASNQREDEMKYIQYNNRSKKEKKIPYYFQLIQIKFHTPAALFTWKTHAS